ncbi:kinase-like domain-containing protein [Infundibulicybe gibba]|nr:kinase-like domain-containing protein [Infundibulicybe gibba]
MTTPHPVLLTATIVVDSLCAEPESEPEPELGPGSLVCSSTSSHRRSSTDPGSFLSPPATPLTASFTPEPPPRPLNQKTTVLLLAPLGQGSFPTFGSPTTSPNSSRPPPRRALHSHHAEHRAQHRSAVGMGRTRSLMRLGRRIGGTRPAEFVSRNHMGGILDERDGDAGVAMDNPYTCPQGRLVAVKLTPRRPPGATSLEAERTRVGFVREVEVLRVSSIFSSSMVVGRKERTLPPFLGTYRLRTCVHGRCPICRQCPRSSHPALIMIAGADPQTRLFQRNTDTLYSTSRTHPSHRCLHRYRPNASRPRAPVSPGRRPPRPRQLRSCVGALSEPILRRIWLELAAAVGWMHGVGLVHRDIKLENILLTAPLQTLGDPLPTHPLIQLTDFGLSRFLPAPSPISSLEEQREQQLLHTRCGSEAYAAPELVLGGPYDARETDAWACGVVLYALVARALPFGEGPASGGRKERRAWLMQIARGEWEWPSCGCAIDSAEGMGDKGCRGKGLVGSAGARAVVQRLMVRDPRKRPRVAEVADIEWELGVGEACASPTCEVNVPALEAVVIEGEEGCAGWLVDADGIGEIARQEVV